ncbi:carbohydrate porin [Pelomonas cellulosilytica]|uniref:Carbohydrate porin n=1 Tax=Pelomonas cellulosilytica TaxID=2906762 RepID=A0ABS8Y134_9BURK|nr:carbohydrate porin [Pelomonas sp. P8]MCE4557705.1 carbohydrate porin [Pelomonas sp. P8]
MIRLTPLAITAALAALATSSHADDGERWSVHAQFTVVAQRHGRFTSPYEGDNSLRADEGTKTTMDATAFLGLRLWQGGEFYVNPELDRGFGLSDTLGAAGFPSGEAYKVGHHSAYGRLQRAFLRETVALGDSAREDVAPAANLLGGSRLVDGLTLTVGKFSVVDVFDTNGTAHDPRSDFLNWSVIDAGAFDYAADSWGYSLGAAAEWRQGDWTARAGVFALSREPNGTRLDASFAQHQGVAELEHRHDIAGRTGTVKLLAFSSRARMGAYDDAVWLGRPADTSVVRRPANKHGFAINAEQALTGGVSAFARYSHNDGRTESFDFTDINQSLSTGVTVKGAAWSRPGHTLGLAIAVNGLSAPAQRYFAAGGLGILVGDGRLARYAREQIAEASYTLPLVSGLSATLDLQRLQHPAYNAERGPVAVIGARLHAEL